MLCSLRCRSLPIPLSAGPRRRRATLVETQEACHLGAGFAFVTPAPDEQCERLGVPSDSEWRQRPPDRTLDSLRLPARALEDLRQGWWAPSRARERRARLQPDCASALASCAATRALFVSRARFARTLSPLLSALRRSSKNGVTLRPRTSCRSASDRAVSSARS